MKITELNGQFAKVCKTSITVKSETGKTAGVITRCYELAPREMSSIWSIVRKAVGLDATECISKMRRIGNEIYYLENINIQDPCAIQLQNAGINVVKYRKLA